MGLLDLVFPKKCLNCGKEGKYICENCLVKVQKLRLVCPYCERSSIDGMTHSKCKRVYGLDGLVSIFDYEGVIRRTILALKYKYATQVAAELSKGLTDELRSHYSDIFPSGLSLVPIPLHWYRGNFRGFNQSEIVGKEVAKEFGWKFTPELLVRKKQTTPQVELKGEARHQNIRGVFALNPTYSLSAIPYSIILFDDVFTTGSTLKEAASVLKRKGAKSVWGLTIAR